MNGTNKREWGQANMRWIDEWRQPDSHEQKTNRHKLGWTDRCEWGWTDSHEQGQANEPGQIDR